MRLPKLAKNMEKTDSQSYYESLPKKPMAAGVLLFNEKDELLIVKPNYRDYWLLPGGIVEENESPKAAALREVKEEINIDLESLRFLAVDYKSPTEGSGEGMEFVFDGGHLSPALIDRIVLQEKELDEYKFASIEEALALLNVYLSKCVAKALEGIKNIAPVYLENEELA